MKGCTGQSKSLAGAADEERRAISPDVARTSRALSLDSPDPFPSPEGCDEHVAIHLEKLSRSFNTDHGLKLAVDSLELDIYQGQVRCSE